MTPAAEPLPSASAVTVAAPVATEARLLVALAEEPVAVVPQPAAEAPDPIEARPETATDQVPAPDPAPEPSAGPGPVPEPLPAPALVQRIQERLEESYPLIAQVLGRSCGISMAGEIVAFQFPESAGIFAERVRDPEVLARLSEVGREVLGRRVVARVEMVAGPTRSAEPPPPEAADEANVGPPADAELSSTAQPPASVAPRALTGTGTTESPADLRQRAEQEPRVQEMLRALKGQLVSVEEL